MFSVKLLKPLPGLITLDLPEIIKIPVLRNLVFQKF